jgi:hypothetical protein
MDFEEARARRDRVEGGDVDASSRAADAKLRRGIREAFARQREGHLAEEGRVTRLRLVAPDPPGET